jgi:hypothetical protein
MANARGASQPKAAAEQGQPTRSPNEEQPLALKAACALLDAHLKFAGIDVSNRACHNIRFQGESVRLENFLIPKNANSKELNYNACLWPKEVGGGWEVGYLNQVTSPCVDRDHFCKVGSAEYFLGLSFRACPGDIDQFVHSKSLLLTGIAGRWERREDSGKRHRARITEDAKIEIAEPGKRATKGTIQIANATTMHVTSKDSMGFTLSFAQVGDDLYLSRGLIAPAKTAESFLLILSEVQRMRRFRGACYVITEPPAEHAVAISCPIKKTEAGQTLSFKLDDSRTVSLYRVGDFWMDSAGTASRYKRVGQKKR